MKISLIFSLFTLISFVTQAADIMPAQKTDHTDIKFAIGARLQQKITPYLHTSLFATCVEFNKNNDELLLALKETREPVHVYNILSKKIKGSIDIPAAYCSLRAAQYACNGTRIVIKADRDLLSNNSELLIHDSKSLALLRTISMSQYWIDYGVHGDNIAVHAGDEILVHTNDQTEGVSFKHAHAGDVSYSPDGSHICVDTHGWHTSQIYIYNERNKMLLAQIAHDDHVKPKYNADGSQLIIARGNRVLLYDTHAFDQDPRTILRPDHEDPQKIYEWSTKTRIILFNSDYTQLAVLTTDALWLYDLPGFVAKKIVLPYEDQSHIMCRGCCLEYSPDGSQLLAGTTTTFYRSNDGIFVCNPKEDNPQLVKLFYTPACVRSLKYYIPDSSRLLYSDQENMYVYNINEKEPSKQLLVKNAYRIAYSPNQCYMAITTEDNFLIRPTLANITFTAAQAALLLKALHTWQKDEAYAIEEQQDNEVYTSLDPLLHDKRLFTV